MEYKDMLVILIYIWKGKRLPNRIDTSWHLFSSNARFNAIKCYLRGIWNKCVIRFTFHSGINLILQNPINCFLQLKLIKLAGELDW